MQIQHQMSNKFLFQGNESNFLQLDSNGLNRTINVELKGKDWHDRLSFTLEIEMYDMNKITTQLQCEQ